MQDILTSANPQSVRRNIVSAGLLAGFAGGAAEVIWIAIYRQLEGIGSADVARGAVVAKLADAAVAVLGILCWEDGLRALGSRDVRERLAQIAELHASGPRTEERAEGVARRSS